MKEPVFFAPSRRFQAGEIATLTGARLVDSEHAETTIGCIAPASEGCADALVFVDGKRNADLLNAVRAAAVLCREEIAASAPPGVAVLVTPRPQAAFAAVARLLFPSAARPEPLTGETGVSAQAHVGPDVDIETGAIVEAGAVICRGASVGRGTIIAPNAVVGQSCRIGRDSFIGPGVTVQCALIGDRVAVHAGARLGQDGFGYVPGTEGFEKIPQVGRVIIQDDVEIGANTTIDRGTLADTVVGEGSKIDNLVQVAHNVRIGRGCVIAGLVGLSGSVTIGDHAMLGGQVGVADHLTVGAGAQLAASSGVMHDVPAGERWAGAPAKPMREAFRELATLRHLVARGSEGRESNG